MPDADALRHALLMIALLIDIFHTLMLFTPLFMLTMPFSILLIYAAAIDAVIFTLPMIADDIMLITIIFATCRYADAAAAALLMSAFLLRYADMPIL